MTPPTSDVTPPTSQMELVATKTPSTSVDVGGKGQQLLNKEEQEREGVKDSDGLPGVLSSATDRIAKKDERQNLAGVEGEGEREGERGPGVNVCLSSATDQPSFSSQLSKKDDEKESTLPGVLSSSTDQEKRAAAGSLATWLSSATDHENGAGLASYPSSATDQPLKKRASLPSTLSSTADQPLQRGAGLPASSSIATDQPLRKGDSFAVDQPLKKGTSLDSFAMGQSFKKEAGLSSSLSSSTDQPLKKGGSFAVDQPLKKGASLDHFLSSSTDQPLKKGEKETHGASLTSFPSSATDPLPLPSRVAAAAPSTTKATKPGLDARNTGVHRDDSLEGLLTIDEELTDSDDDDDDSYDYVEEIVSSLAYVPSDPTTTPKRRGETAQLRSSVDSWSNKEEKVNPKPDNVSLLVHGQLSTTTTTSMTPQQTPTKAKSSTPSQQVATPISDSSLVPVSPLSAGIAISEFSEAKNTSATEAMPREEEMDDFSDVLKSDEDEDEIEKLLGEAEELLPKKMSAVDKKEASELFASVIKAAEEKEMAEKKEERDAVSNSKQVKNGEPTSQKKEDVLDIEAQYEDSEWNSEDEESDGEPELGNEEEVGGGTALVWLSNAGLADPFLSPLTSPTNSTPTSPRKVKPKSLEEESKTAAASLDEAVISSTGDTGKEKELKEKEGERKESEKDDPGYPLVRKVTTTYLPEDEKVEKKGEREVDLQMQPSSSTTAAVVEPGQPLQALEHKVTTTRPLPERKGEREDSVQIIETSTTVTAEPGHPLERKETLTHLPKNKKEERGEGHTGKETEAVQGDNEQGHPLVRKETVIHLPESKEGEKVQTTIAAADVEPGHPLTHKETLTHLAEDKGGVHVDDSIQATAATDVYNEPEHPLERKVTLTHLPEKEKKEALHSAAQHHHQQPRVHAPLLAISPGRHTALNKPMGVVHGRGLVGRVTDVDDTEEDATGFTNTESEVRKERGYEN